MQLKIKGGILATIGYLLSPLSWWNDIIVNIPLAYAFAYPFGLISRNLFPPAMVFGYWLTNITGFLLLHYGVRDMIAKEKKPRRKGWLFKDIAISLLYTAIVIILVSLGWLKFPLEYFK
ncbi:MAG TPA: hypothetical protein VF399_09090 [bacterium]